MKGLAQQRNFKIQTFPGFVNFLYSSMRLTLYERPATPSRPISEKPRSSMNPIDVLKRNTVSFITEEELTSRLKEDRPLRVKLGCDPTRPDLTFGHVVVLRKLRQFQNLGHQAILIIGDYTALIGDPSGRSMERPDLSKEEIKANAETYMDQAFKVLDESRTTVRRNSEWFGKMEFEDALKLARKMTVARMLERDDFAKRYAGNSPISIVEFLYPLLQGYDSIVTEADVELGGTDQTFNLLVGRALQKDAGKPEQAVITLPLLLGLDGVDKMSKSLNNYIALNDNSKDMFGKIMSVSDEVMWDYYRLLLLTQEAEIETLKSAHPMQAKKDLALKLTSQFHSKKDALRELEQFDKVFSKGRAPDDMPIFAWKQLAEGETTRLIDILGSTGLFSSKKEARRLVDQGAVRIDGERCSDPNTEVSRPKTEIVVQAGKRLFFKLLP